MFIQREESGDLDDAWAAIPSGTDLPFSSLEEIRRLISPHLDQNLITHLAATRSREYTEYGILWIPENAREADIGVVDPEQVINLYHLMGCTPYQGPWNPPSYRFSQSASDLPPWPMVNGPVPIASRAWLEEHLQLSPENVQLLPVKVEAKDGGVPGYVALDLLQSAHVWDLERSTWEGAHWDPKVPFGLRHMVAAAKITSPAPLFRNADFRPHVIADEETGTLICKHSPRSVEMKSIEGFSS